MEEEPTPLTESAARETREELTRLGAEIREQGAHLLQEEREVIARQVGSVGNALRAGADSFDDDGQPALAEYSRGLASRVDEVTHDIETRDLESMLEGARRFANENPAVVIGGAALAGFLFARLLKSSALPARAAELGEPAHTHEPVFEGARFGEHERR